MACTCISDINARLEDHTLDTGIVISGKRGMVAQTLTDLHRRDTGKLERRSGKPHLFAHTYCPFCGIRYEQAANVATILTADGIYFDYTAPDAAAFTLNAIARGLANTCRFGGQCDRFYSVAEHSVWVSRIVPPEHAVAGLFHDAAEAFITDMPKPLKELLPDYKAVEARVEAVLFPAIGLPAQLPPEIKIADRTMLATEQRLLMRNRDEWKWTGGVEPLDIELACELPNEAYHAFLARAAELGVGG